MNEVEKLYENVGIEPIVRDNAIGRGYYIEHQRVEEYPPFTADKQLELTKWLIQYVGEFYVSFTAFGTLKDWEMLYDLKFSVHRNSFEECLAGFINSLWQDLTSEEKEQIRRILNV